MVRELIEKWFPESKFPRDVYTYLKVPKVRFFKNCVGDLGAWDGGANRGEAEDVTATMDLSREGDLTSNGGSGRESAQSLSTSICSLQRISAWVMVKNDLDLLDCLSRLCSFWTPRFHLVCLASLLRGQSKLPAHLHMPPQ